MGGVVGIPKPFAPPGIRIAIVNNHPWLRDAMQAVLEQSGKLHVVASGTGNAAFDAARSHGAEVVLAILDGDFVHDRALLEALAAERIVSVVVLDPHTTGSHAAAAARRAFAVVRHTQCAREIIEQLLRAAGAQRPALPTPAVGAQTSGLSELDRRLIRLSAGGVPLNEIAELLGMSRTEAWDHLIAILDMFELSDRVQLAAYAMSHGLLGDVNVGAEFSLKAS
jgi:DNA-binding NarL/FixJ family response regulator